MKKLFILFAISSLGFVACNDASNEEGTESVEVSADSSSVDPSLGNPPVNPTDTMVNLDTTSASADTSSATRL